MIRHDDLNDQELFRSLKTRSICFAGNENLKIYGKLTCKSGRRMNKNNRVFFTTEAEALAAGFRPCGHCMNAAYKKWKDGIV